MFKRESQYSHVTREEFTQYMIRGKEGFERVHHRLKSLEDMRDELNRLITSIEKWRPMWSISLNIRRNKSKSWIAMMQGLINWKIKMDGNGMISLPTSGRL